MDKSPMESIVAIQDELIATYELVIAQKNEEIKILKEMLKEK